MSRLSRRALGAGVVPLSVALALAGCGTETEPAAAGGSSKPSSSSSSTTTKAEPPSASSLYAKARKTALAAESGHIAGTMTNSGDKFTIDLAGTVDGTNQSLGLGRGADGKITILTVGGKNYLSATEDFWADQVGAGPAKTLQNKFVILPAAQAKEFGDLTIKGLLTEMFEDKQLSVLDGANTRVEKTTIDGADAWKLTERSGGDGAALVVSADDKATLLRIEGPTDDPGRLDFSEWDEVPAVTAPAPSKVIELPK
ncbi:hypothetical protein GCM10025782_27530 [Pedococcus ginsenosidimutans]|uniref:Lipoprotein n=1 Tax=Pedococcus ginsenosidimutans TaxID=490570 RepID=A0ABP8YHU5_9MICO